MKNKANEINQCRFFFSLSLSPAADTFRTSNKSKDSNHKVTMRWWQSEDGCRMQIKVRNF